MADSSRSSSALSVSFPLIVRPQQLAVLTHGGGVTVAAGDQGARFLPVAGRPLKEPAARGGPFATSTRDEIHQAFTDYNESALV